MHGTIPLTLCLRKIAGVGFVANGPEPEFGVSLIDAVQDQLGLRLERKKGQTDILVVDRADKVPTDN